MIPDAPAPPPPPVRDRCRAGRAPCGGPESGISNLGNGNSIRDNALFADLKQVTEENLSMIKILTNSGGIW